MNRMNIRRGEAYFISAIDENARGKVGIVVSSDRINAAGSNCIVVYTTIQASDSDSVTHVTVRSLNKVCVAICERPVSLPQARLGDYIGELSDSELMSIDIALEIALGLGGKSSHIRMSETMNVKHVEQEPPTGDISYDVIDQKTLNEVLHDQLIRAEAERNVYKDMYYDLLMTVFGGAQN